MFLIEYQERKVEFSAMKEQHLAFIQDQISEVILNIFCPVVSVTACE